MTNRRNFLTSLLAALVTAPLVRLGWLRAPYCDPALLVSPRMCAAFASSAKGLFNPAAPISRQWKQGMMADFVIAGRKIGDTIAVRRPARFVSRDGENFRIAS